MLQAEDSERLLSGQRRGLRGERLRRPWAPLRFRISVDTSHPLLGIIPWRREKVMLTLDPDEAADAEALRSLLLRHLPDIPETQRAVPLPTLVAEATRRFSRE